MTSQISIARWFSSGTDDTGIVPAGKNASTNTLVADPQGSPPKHPQGDAHPPLSPRTPGPQQQRDVFAVNKLYKGKKKKETDPCI